MVILELVYLSPDMEKAMPNVHRYGVLESGNPIDHVVASMDR